MRRVNAARVHPDPDRETARRVLDAAVGWIGTPYRHQASQKGVGCDCLGLVRGVWREVYGSEPDRPGPYAPDWAEAGGGDPLIAAGPPPKNSRPHTQRLPCYQRI